MATTEKGRVMSRQARPGGTGPRAMMPGSCGGRGSETVDDAAPAPEEGLSAPVKEDMASSRFQL